MKFGLFIHWGIYSVPAGIWNGEKIPRLGEQIQRHARIPQDEYAALSLSFNPINFDAREIAAMAAETGMKYIVLTAKHHDGFCMFKTDTTDFNIVDATPYGRDILKDLSDACLEYKLKLGVYFSNPDWHAPESVERKEKNSYAVFEEFTLDHLNMSRNQLTELLTNYGIISEVFFDMGLPTVEDSTALAATVHNTQPDCLVSGRVMNNQGDFLTLPDNHLPDNPIEQGWETPCTFYHTWGYKSWIERPSLEDQLNKQIRLLSRVTSSGGNYLLNIGPLSDGSVLPYEKEVLRGIGLWMNKNGEAIHGTERNPLAYHSWGYASRKRNNLYLHVHKWPDNSELELNYIGNDPYEISILGENKSLEWRRTEKSIIITVPCESPDPYLTVITCRYIDKIGYLKPISEPVNETVTLTREVEVSSGNYNNLQYNTNIPDTQKSWNFTVEKQGNYKVQIHYTLENESMPLILQSDEKRMEIFLKGAEGKSDEGFSDGNEVEIKTEISSEYVFTTDDRLFYEKGIHSLTMKKNSNLIKEDGVWTEADITSPHAGLWCLNDVWTSHRAAFARHSMKGLSIQKIMLIQD